MLKISIVPQRRASLIIPVKKTVSKKLLKRDLSAVIFALNEFARKYSPFANASGFLSREKVLNLPTMLQKEHKDPL
jgi:hypothetical protein